MSWLDDTENHRKRQVALMAKAFGDSDIQKATDGYLVSKFPIDIENEEGEEKEATTLSEAIDVALQYQDDLDNAKAPEQIMYKEE